MKQNKMKKNGLFNIMISFVAALFILSLFSGIAVAESSDLGDPDNNTDADVTATAEPTTAATTEPTSVATAEPTSAATDEPAAEPTEDPADESISSGTSQERTPREVYTRTREAYLRTKERYENARDNFKDAEERFKDARKKFRTARDTVSREELIERTKEYLERAIDQMISHLQVVKDRIENSDKLDLLPFDAAANVDEHITQLEEIKINVQQAETAQDLRDAANELKEQWIKIRLETRYYTGILINHRVDKFLGKTDDVSAKMDQVIERLKEDGKDTEKLEKYASNFNDLVSEAKGLHEVTLDLYDTHDGFDSNGMTVDIPEARDFLEEAYDSQKKTHRTMKKAGNELKHFFREAKKQNGGRVVVKGTGTLEAHGSGNAAIEGDVTVTVSGEVTLIVSGNADVTTEGEGTKEELGNGNIKYQGFGQATISGDDITVKISGNEIDLIATGTGRAVLRGTGTYTTEKDFKVTSEWEKEV